MGLTFPKTCQLRREHVVPGGAATLIDVTMEATGEFGTLKAVLGAIPAVYANREVRLRPPAQNSSLTNASAGIHHHRR